MPPPRPLHRRDPFDVRRVDSFRARGRRLQHRRQPGGRHDEIRIEFTRDTLQLVGRRRIVGRRVKTAREGRPQHRRIGVFSTRQRDEDARLGGAREGCGVLPRQPLQRRIGHGAASTANRRLASMSARCLKKQIDGVGMSHTANVTTHCSTSQQRDRACGIPVCPASKGQS
jgi:hypothetical protein